MKYLSYLVFILLFAYNTFAQYTLDPNFLILPDEHITSQTNSLSIPLNKADVKYIGMGKTGTANGRKINAMMYNPALLSRSRFSVEGISINLSLPPATFDAANFIDAHIGEFKDALSLKEVWAGIEDFNNSTDINQQLSSVKRIQNGLQFPRDLFEQVIGKPDNPTTHGVQTIPSFGLQIGNFGLSLYGIGCSTVHIIQSPVIDALLNVKIPDAFNDPQQVADAVLSLQGILQPIADGASFNDALPFAYSVSYVDLVGAAGYAYNFSPDLSIGLNLKVVNRRFSAKKFSLEQYNEILNILKNDLDQSVTGFTFDLGGLYKFSSGTEIGLAIQNIIPVKKVASEMVNSVTKTYLEYERNTDGSIKVNSLGDTVMQSVSRKVESDIPFNLELPMLINLGVIYPITGNLDAALDIVDAANQDLRYEDYLSRFRVGTEYRLDVLKDLFGVAFRIGVADKRFTGGFGLNIFRALQVDGAYAYENFVKSYSYYAQVRLGW
jgi:hypothetical protein